MGAWYSITCCGGNRTGNLIDFLKKFFVKIYSVTDDYFLYLFNAHIFTISFITFSKYNFITSKILGA